MGEGGKEERRGGEEQGIKLVYAQGLVNNVNTRPIPSQGFFILLHGFFGERRDTHKGNISKTKTA